MRRLAPAILFCFCLLAPDLAEAGTLSREGNTVVYTDAGDVANQVFLFEGDGADGTYFVGDSNATVTDDDSGCADQGGDLFSCSGVAAFRVDVGGGNDEVRGDGSVGSNPPLDIPLIVDLGGGSTNFAVGGDADDDLRGGPGGDNLVGGPGSDTLDGGFGADGLDGGADGDVVTYAKRTEAVTVDFTDPAFQAHGSSNDGPPGVRDHIQNVETVVGGSGNDTMKAGTDAITFRGGAGDDRLTGSPGVETLIGGDGADAIDALAGSDTVLAGAGADTVEARDGAQDVVDCGPDSDTANVDAIDEITSCGQEPPPATIFVPTPAAPSRVLFDLTYTFAAARRGTTLRNLTADVEPGARVAATCRTKKNRRCTRTKDLARTARSLRLKGFEGKRLPVGAKLTVRVTKDGMIGAVKTLTIRKRKAPSLKTLCIPPGAARPSLC